jgi:hypothetical protein
MNLHIFDDSLNQKYNENKILIWNGEKINRVLENNKIFKYNSQYY